MSNRTITAADVVKTLNKSPKTISQICVDLNSTDTPTRSILSTLIDVGYVRKERRMFILTGKGNEYLETLQKSTKICIFCKKEKPTTEYYNNVTRPDGLQDYCKECDKLRHQKQQTLSKLPAGGTFVRAGRTYSIPKTDFTSMDFRELNEDVLKGKHGNTHHNVLTWLLSKGKIIRVGRRKVEIIDSNGQPYIKEATVYRVTGNNPTHEQKEPATETNTLDGLNLKSPRVLLHFVDEMIAPLRTALGNTEDAINTIESNKGRGDEQIQISVMGLLDEARENTLCTSDHTEQTNMNLIKFIQMYSNDSLHLKKCLSELIAIQKKQLLLFEALANKKG